MTAIAVTIAGSDSSGGAGIQADLKTFSALGVYGASVIAALTAQNTRGVQAIQSIPADFVRQQIDSVFSDLAVGAVKIGMLSEPEIIRTVADGLEKYSVTQIVLDPVMVAASGDRLVSPRSIDSLRQNLLPRALLVTPNLPEAAALLEESEALDEETMIAQGKRILSFGPQAVLVKGGHGSGAESADFLIEKSGVTRFSAPRLNSRNTHGTGCTLSSAIAAGLAKKLALKEAVGAAKTYLTAALAAADNLHIGHGTGPVSHFYALWK